jgi:hypothetical protein
MNHTLVVVLNGTKARFFTLESANFPEHESGPNLIEHEALINEENELSGQEVIVTTITDKIMYSSLDNVFRRILFLACRHLSNRIGSDICSLSPSRRC